MTAADPVQHSVLKTYFTYVLASNGTVLILVSFVRDMQPTECCQCFDAVGWAAGRASSL